MSQATLSERFQLSIPNAIRELLNLRAGQQFVVTKAYRLPAIAGFARRLLAAAACTPARRT